MVFRVGDLSANFSKWEFMCKCGCGEGDMDPDLLLWLQDARSIADVPFHINSGYRCKAHNISLGGERDSDHLYGNAADISAKTSHKKFVIVTALLDAGFTRMKLYPGHIHVDCGEKRSGSGKHGERLMWGAYK